VSPSAPAPASGARVRASATVAAGILSSRLAGLVRERIFAHFFGASPVADAWRAALRMPNVLQNLLGEGTLSASFIPIYSELLEEKRDEEAARFAGAIFGLLTLAAGLMAVLGILLAPLLVGLFFAGFDPDRQALTVTLVRILFPMTALLVVSAWALGILNSHRRFFLPYVAPVVWNAAIIAALLVGGLQWGLDGEGLARVMAWGALIGGGLQLLVQLPTALRLLGEFRPSLSLQVEGVREAIANFVPVVMARGAVNLGGMLDYALAAFLAAGAVASMGYAQTLYVLPISLFAMSVAASELPELSRNRREEARAGLADDVEQARVRVAYFLIPSAVGYLFLGDVITAAVFQTGAFGQAEVLVTWGILAAYALGMPASAQSRLLSSAFYALRDTRTPARIAYLRVVLSLGVGATLMFPMDRIEVGPLRLGAAGLALGATVAAWTELFLLRRALRPKLRAGSGAGAPDEGGTGAGIREPSVHGGGDFSRLVLAAALAAAAGVGIHLVLPPGLHPWTVALGTLLPFGGVYLAATLALGVGRPLKSLLNR
jgi:putative peptidoglycan lipid II flippase